MLFVLITRKILFASETEIFMGFCPPGKKSLLIAFIIPFSFFKLLVSVATSPLHFRVLCKRCSWRYS